MAFVGAERAPQIVSEENDLQHGSAIERDGDQEEHRQKQQHMGQDRVQKDPGIDGRQAEIDARRFRAAGRKRAHVCQMRPWLSDSRGLRSDGMLRADNAYHSGLYLDLRP